jgi:S-adenosylmethionine synthetase
VPPDRLGKLIEDFFDLRPAAIIHELDLRRPIFRNTASYGHFGRTEKSFTWEHVSRLEEFRAGVEAL